MISLQPLSKRYHSFLLCGFMGAGKNPPPQNNSNGLAPKTFDYLDLDQIILQKSGHNTILKMMKALGEKHFRRIENEILVEQLKQEKAKIIALGGGALNAGLNHVLRKRDDILVIWLDIPFEQCLYHLRKDHKNVRPLAKQGEQQLQKLYLSRREIYSVAQVQIDNKALANIKDYAQFTNEVERQLNPNVDLFNKKK